MKEKRSLLGKTYLVLFLLFMYLPIGVMIAYSFNESKSRSVFTGFTLDWYSKLLNNDAILSSLVNSMIIAFASSVIAVVLGTMAAIGIQNMKKRARTLVLNVSYLPIINPEIITGVSLMLLFVWMKLEFGFTTLILAHIAFNVPYVVMSVMPKLFQLDKTQVEAAEDLGCSPRQAFWKVVLPQIKPGITSGFLIAMTYSFDDFVISHFVSGASAQTLPLTIYSMTRKKVSPEINALSALMFVVILGILVANNVYEARKQKKKEAENYVKG